MLIIVGWLGLFFYSEMTAFATLGESASSVELDRVALQGMSTLKSIHQNKQSQFTVQEIKAATTTIREYVSPSNTIFAVAWNGLVHPPLNQIFGSYFSQYQEGRKQNPAIPGQRRSYVLHTDQLIVETWGHGRNLQGRAYLPELLPKGFPIHDIK